MKRYRELKGGDTEVLTQSGDIMDFSEIPLIYGEDDPFIAGELRGIVEDFERENIDGKVESGIIITNDRTVIPYSGEESKMKLPRDQLDNAIVMTHNHSRNGKLDSMEIGGTFSESDVKGFTETKVRCYRANAFEGVYSISKTSKFNSDGFSEYMSERFKSRKDQYDNEIFAIKKMRKSGEIKSLAEHVQKLKIAANRYRARVHKDLLAAQEEYGYVYTLERRKKHG